MSGGKSPVLRIGTRGSPLALWQAHAVQAALAEALNVAPAEVAVEVIRTTGDQIQDRALSEAGGKGLFTKELEEALLDGRVDLAVHSAKDVATYLPEGLHLAGYLPRADVRDALILKSGAGLADLPAGARVGTASLRREAQLRRLRPDLKVELLRGNVHTRLARVRDGDFDGTLLALAGLTRLGLADVASAVLATSEFLPAVGQGAVAIECRVHDPATNAAIAAIACRDTGIALAAERARLMDEAAAGGMLAVLGLDEALVAGIAAAHGLAVAIRNAPRHVVLAGPAAGIAPAATVLEAAGASRLVHLAVRTPSHTPLLASAAEGFRQHLAGLPDKRLPFPVFSAIDGTPARTASGAVEALARQICTPLDWAACLEAVAELQPDAVLEIGPGNALAKLFGESAPAIPVRASDDFRSIDGIVRWLDSCA